jgi:predicted nucleotidyltransferase
MARRISESHPSVRAVLLYGSVAAGQADEGSDVDLAVLADEGTRNRALLGALTQGDRALVNLIVLTPQGIKASQAHDWSFLAYLSKAAVVLAGDPEVAIGAVTLPRPSDEVTLSQLGGLSRDVESAGHMLEDARSLLRRGGVRRESGHMVQSQALYALYRDVRQAIILEAAAAGEDAWSRHEAFSLAAQRHPKVARDVERMASLEGHWRAVHREDALGPLLGAPQSRAALASARRVVTALMGSVGDGTKAPPSPSQTA